MKTTRDGKALYLHCLPADINDVSCVDGEVEASVFDRYRTPLYKEASFKPYIIAAMIFLAKCKDPQAVLKALDENGILGGLPVEGGILWCVTEVVTKEELDRAAAVIKEVC